MNKQKLRIATRQSPLALWQAHHVAGILSKHYPHLQVELLPLVTAGDRFLKDKLQVLGGKGLFVKELESALLNHEADIAVHSAKDMPAEIPSDLKLAVICEREDPFDAFISTKYGCLEDLPLGATIGTSSLRRQSQLLAYRASLLVHTLRGNINTRLDKLYEGSFDAIILAVSGLRRLGLEQCISQHIPMNVMLPACGQGALCIECRTDDLATQRLISILNHQDSAVCVHAERQVNAALGGNCHLPLAVFASIAQETFMLQAKILAPDGQRIIAHTQSGPIAESIAIADACTQALLAQGARDLLDSFL